MKAGKRISDFLLVLIFVLGACVAGIWWYMMPKGFHVLHPRFWVNGALPPLAVITCMMGVIGVIRNQGRLLQCLVWILGSLVTFSGITAACLFPISVRGNFLVAVLIAVISILLLGGFVLWSLRKERIPVWLLVLCVFGGIIFGMILPWSQHARSPDTKPFSQKALIPSANIVRGEDHTFSLTDKITVSPPYGEVAFDLGDIFLSVHPLLTFDDNSPDRFWTIFSPVGDRFGAVRSLLGVTRDSGSITLDYQDNGQSRLQVGENSSDKSIVIEALSFLPQAVYSHLNSFCEIHISSPGDLALSFSPVSEVVDMKEFGYPSGKPLRMAYLDRENEFHVVEANNGEKGPFAEIIHGAVTDDEPLAITIYSDKTPKCRITLYDWLSQASRQLSPAAGWGLPENAIEFSCFYGNRSNEGVIFITLAATSTGRGWDSVGHAAGTYRNRMKIETITPSEADKLR